MTALKLFIMFFLTMLIYDLILFFSKPLFFKAKEKIKKFINKIKYYINKRKNKNLCNTCICYNFLQNRCLYKDINLTDKIKKCSDYKKNITI